MCDKMGVCWSTEHADDDVKRPSSDFDQTRHETPHGDGLQPVSMELDRSNQSLCSVHTGCGGGNTRQTMLGNTTLGGEIVMDVEFQQKPSSAVRVLRDIPYESPATVQFNALSCRPRETPSAFFPGQNEDGAFVSVRDATTGESFLFLESGGSQTVDRSCAAPRSLRASSMSSSSSMSHFVGIHEGQRPFQ